MVHRAPSDPPIRNTFLLVPKTSNFLSQLIACKPPFVLDDILHSTRSSRVSWWESDDVHLILYLHGSFGTHLSYRVILWGYSLCRFPQLYLHDPQPYTMPEFTRHMGTQSLGRLPSGLWVCREIMAWCRHPCSHNPHITE